jgi:uncharacterized membrane protein YbhN (UPF0104 family)
MDLEEQRRKYRPWTVLTALSAVIAVVALIAFFMTEDWTQTITFADQWTMLMVVLLAVQLVVSFLALNYAPRAGTQQAGKGNTAKAAS